MASFSGWSRKRLRAVEDPRAVAFGAAEQMRGIEILDVERRIAAHQDRIDRGKRRPAGRAGDSSTNQSVDALAGREASAASLSADGAHRAPHLAAALPVQVAAPTGEQLMAAPCRLAHHREGGVLGGIEGLERVGDEQQFHGQVGRIL